MSEEHLRILLEPFRPGSTLSLPNRIVMAPMTRSQAEPDGLVPTEAMAAYYARRADAGLILTEGTVIRPDGHGYSRTPGIYTDAQIEGWRRITDRVHGRGGRVFVQLWHVGRVSHPAFLGGADPVAPSAVPLTGRVPRSDGLEYGTPRALEAEEIPGIVAAFASAAENADRAGFDGVEIHGANGYLIDQFLHVHTNRRTDAYGGDPERRMRFALEVVDAVVAAIGAERTGLRVSPGAHLNMEGHPEDTDTFAGLLERLGERHLAYIHNGIFDDRMVFSYLGSTAGAFLRRHHPGPLMGCGSYDPLTAAEAIASGRFDLIAFGRPFLANPDLVARVRNHEPLVPFSPAMLGRLD